MTETKCPPHRFIGVKQLCEHCGVQKGTVQQTKDWQARQIATGYRCDMRGCRQYVEVAGTMYQHGDAFLCEACHEAKVAEAHACVICGEQTDGSSETCGDGRSKCARTLRKRSERGHDHED